MIGKVKINWPVVNVGIGTLALELELELELERILQTSYFQFHKAYGP